MKYKMIKAAFAGLVLVVSGFANAALIVIDEVDLSSDSSILDFTSVSAGTITGTNAYFQNFGISLVEFLGVTINNGDVANSGTDGKGLFAINNALSVANVNGRIDAFSASGGFRFLFANNLMQFGFQIIDQINMNLRIQTFSNGVLVDSLRYTPSGNFPIASIFYESSSAINEFRVTNDGTSYGGWGLDNIVVASKVPEPSTLAILALGLIGLGARRFKK